MSILSGAEIVRQVELGNIVIDPFDPKRVGPNSYEYVDQVGPTASRFWKEFP